MNENTTSVMGLEMREHDLHLLDVAPEWIYVKAIKVSQDCGPQAVIVKIDNAIEIDHCGIPK